MAKITPELQKDLAELAAKYGTNYTNLIDEICDTIVEEDRKADIEYRLQSYFDYQEKDITEDLVDRIYRRFVHSEDSDKSLWDNIDSAINWILEGYDNY